MGTGQHVVIVRAEAVTMSGGLVRQKMRFSRFLRLRMNTKPSKGPIHFRSPAKILWRSIRGMLPHKTKRGTAALARLKVFEGVPAPYDKMKRVVVPEALKVLSLLPKHNFCTLGRLASEVGWKYGPIVEELEGKRKEASKEFYTQKKAGIKAIAAAKVACASELEALAPVLAPIGM